MPPMTPTGHFEIQIGSLGTARGFDYANGVRQITGIPYGQLAKRWTRSVLATSWPNSFHDGTKLGCSAPNPPEYNAGPDLLTPVPSLKHFNEPEEDELRCLVMNITLPPKTTAGPHPVMCYIHGGSFLFGGANRAIFDGVETVSYSVERNTPVIAVNFNYRVGLGGFLASEAIRKDLQRDGFDGVGNFGLTDQQVALQWIQEYIPYLGGDHHNVTIYGESAGGMSVSHQLVAKTPAIFHRAIAMSGALNTIPTWSMQKHEEHYRALLKYLKIDPSDPQSLEKLRRVPQDVVAAATVPLEGVFVCTGNPCDDGVFHSSPPSFNTIASPPDWLKSYMIGDVYDEAMIFSLTLADENYISLRDGLCKFLDAAIVDLVLDSYGIKEDVSRDVVLKRFEDLAGDVIFKTQDFVSVHRSNVPQTYGYHFDQRSTLDNALKGQAYHALDLLYVFATLQDQMSTEQLALIRKMQDAWIDFAYGKDPWERFDVANKWMVFGPDDKWNVKTEDEDENVRKYSRMKKFLDLGIYQDLLAAVDHICVKRDKMGAVLRREASDSSFKSESRVQGTEEWFEEKQNGVLQQS